MHLAIIINYTYILAFHLSHGSSFPVRSAGSDNHVYHIYYMTDLLRHLLHFVDQLSRHRAGLVEKTLSLLDQAFERQSRSDSIKHYSITLYSYSYSASSDYSLQFLMVQVHLT